MMSARAAVPGRSAVARRRRRFLRKRTTFSRPARDVIHKRRTSERASAGAGARDPLPQLIYLSVKGCKKCQGKPWVRLAHFFLSSAANYDTITMTFFLVLFAAHRLVIVPLLLLLFCFSQYLFARCCKTWKSNLRCDLHSLFLFRCQNAWYILRRVILFTPLSACKCIFSLLRLPHY